MKLKRKCGNRAGFTLAETLLAVLILLLVSVIVATGIPVAKNAYEKVVLGANAQVLLSTTISALRDELGFARNPVVEADSVTITYYNAETGIKSQIAKDGDGKIVLKRAKGTMATMDPRPLVSDAAATGDLYATYTGVAYSGGCVQFTGLRVCRKDSDVDLTGLSSTVQIRVFAPNVVSAGLIYEMTTTAPASADPGTTDPGSETPAGGE